jgi:photosystem II stability/assembly factor-like uncharacterized protein
MFESCRAHLAMPWARSVPLLALLAALLSTAAGAGSGEAPSYWLVETAKPHAPYGVIVWDGRSHIRLFESGNWRDATPARLPGTIQDVFFLDQQHGWLIAADCATATGALFRTTDAGRSWKQLPRRWVRNCSAGSGFYLDFADQLHGWVTAVDPHAANGSIIYRTTSGGRRWNLATKARDQGSDGPVRFVSPKLGWRATTWLGWPRPGPLLRTRDGGRTWAADRELPENRRYSTPVRVGSSVVTAGARAGRIAVYERIAARWGRSGVVFAPTPITDVVVSAPAPDVRWLATGKRASLAALHVSVDRGRTWSRRVLPRGTGQLVARSATEAWVSANRQLWMTSDGGRTWRRLTPLSGRRHEGGILGALSAR